MSQKTKSHFSEREKNVANKINTRQTSILLHNKNKTKQKHKTETRIIVHYSMWSELNPTTFNLLMVQSQKDVVQKDAK